MARYSSTSHSGGDTRWASASTLLFSLTLGVAGLVLPVLAVDAGHSLSTVGALYAASSVIQVLLRPLLGVAVRYVSTRTLVQAGALAQTLSLLVVFGSVGIPALAGAWALQAVARSAFWTGMDTHGARSADGPSRALGRIHAWAGIGQLSGPLTAGVVSDHDVDATIVAAATIALICLAASTRLRTHERQATDRRTTARRVWRSPGIGSSLAAGFSAGTWRGLLDSIIPVLLREAGQSFAAIGLAISVANAASIPGSAIVTRLGAAHSLKIAFVSSTLGGGLAVAIVAVPTSIPAVAYAALALGGMASGTLQTLGPVLAAAAVPEVRLGEAIALQGMFRTLSMLCVPAVVSSLATALPVAAALGVVGVAMTATVRCASAIDSWR